MSGHTNRRLAERVREVLGQLVPRLKDPRIGFVTITDVRLVGDNDRAQVYWTVLPDNPRQRQDTAAGLASASGLLRRDLGAALHVRKVPTLELIYDEVPEHGRRIDQLLARVEGDDEEGTQA